MFKFSPRDIQNQEFKKVLRGYDSVEVDAYLEMLSEEFESLVKANKALQVKLAQYEDELKETPVKPAENVVEPVPEPEPEMQAETRVDDSKAQQLIREAEIKANDIISGAHRDLEQIRDEVETLKKQKNAFTRKIKQLLKAQFELVKILEADDRQLSELKIVERRKRKGSLPEKTGEHIEAEKIPERDIRGNDSEEPPSDSVEPEFTAPKDEPEDDLDFTVKTEDDLLPGPDADPAPGADLQKENLQFQADIRNEEQQLAFKNEESEEDTHETVEGGRDTEDSKASTFHNGFNLIDNIIDSDQEDNTENNDIESNNREI